MVKCCVLLGARTQFLKYYLYELRLKRANADDGTVIANSVLDRTVKGVTVPSRLYVHLEKRFVVFGLQNFCREKTVNKETGLFSKV
jgi:hypothetical protein